MAKDTEAETLATKTLWRGKRPDLRPRAGARAAPKSPARPGEQLNSLQEDFPLPAVKPECSVLSAEKQDSVFTWRNPAISSGEPG